MIISKKKVPQTLSVALSEDALGPYAIRLDYTCPISRSFCVSLSVKEALQLADLLTDRAEEMIASEMKDKAPSEHKPKKRKK